MRLRECVADEMLLSKAVGVGGGEVRGREVLDLLDGRVACLLRERKKTIPNRISFSTYPQLHWG